MRFALTIIVMFSVGFAVGVQGFQAARDAHIEPVLHMPMDARAPPVMGGPFVPLEPRDVDAPGFPDLDLYPPEPPRMFEPMRLPVSEDETEFG